MSEFQCNDELRMGITAVRRKFGSTRERVADTKVPLVIEKYGEPIAAMISLDDFRWLQEQRLFTQDAEAASPTIKDDPALRPD